MTHPEIEALLEGAYFPDNETREAVIARVSAVVEALEFYADPDSYFAIAFMFDRHCGEFADDFDEEFDQELFDYGRPMPGAKARKTLQPLPKGPAND